MFVGYVEPRRATPQAYPLQKTAYRRANGGSGAPGVHEDAVPRAVSACPADWQERLQAALEPRLVVKNTFLDVAAVERPARRCKTTALVAAR